MAEEKSNHTGSVCGFGEAWGSSSSSSSLRRGTCCASASSARCTVGHEVLKNTISTNGRVEPETNNQFYSPIATTVKAIYVQPGDKVKAGKVLMVLDDVDARAREATAESGVKAARRLYMQPRTTARRNKTRCRRAILPALNWSGTRRSTIWTH